MEKRHYEKMMKQQQNTAIASYYGIINSRVEILYNTLDSNPETHEKLLTQAYRLGLNYENSMTATI
ncbi:hypothetical protein D3C77_737960 [compost metagenome]